MLTREDRQAIDGLFERLREAERRGGPRDAEAEAYIQHKMAEQRGAAYYLAQTVVVQQEALKEAERRMEELERSGRQVAQRRGPWDRDPADTAYDVEYALLLRDGIEMRAVHDRHVEGLFSRQTWLAILGGAGFTVEVIERPLEGLDDCTDRMLLCRRR